MYQGDVYVAPHYTLDECKNVFQTLNPWSSQDEWSYATNILTDRMNARFFYAINLLSDRCNDRVGHNMSFSIMALNCLMIETLQQFYDGTDETQGRNQNAFIKFLRRSRYFKEQFNYRLAQQFYSDVRCGILHQAQTKGNVALEFNNYESMVHNRSGWLIINTEKFSRALYDEFVDYIDNLMSINEYELRENFIRKMTFIVQKAEARLALDS